MKSVIPFCIIFLIKRDVCGNPCCALLKRLIAVVFAKSAMVIGENNQPFLIQSLFSLMNHPQHRIRVHITVHDSSVILRAAEAEHMPGGVNIMKDTAVSKINVSLLGDF